MSSTYERVGRNYSPLGITQGNDRPVLFMTSDRTAYRTDSNVNDFDKERIAQHLLKVYEIFDASEQKLPKLQSVEMNLHAYS